MKRILLKLSVIPVLAVAVFMATPRYSTAAQQLVVCDDGTFKCTCNGQVTCQASIQDCWNSC